MSIHCGDDSRRIDFVRERNSMRMLEVPGDHQDDHIIVELRYYILKQLNLNQKYNFQIDL